MPPPLSGSHDPPLQEIIVKRILHLNLHREFFSQIAAGTKRTEYRSQHLTGKSVWKIANPTRFNSAMATPRTRRKCRWNFLACAGLKKTAKMFMPSGWEKS